MLFAFDCAKKVIPQLNVTRIIAKDFWNVCEIKRCDVTEMELDKPGYYVTDGKEDYIFLDHRLREYKWLIAAFEELFHLIVHFPCDFLLEKQQIEAKTLAIVAMIPQPELFRLLRVYEQLEREMQFLVYKRLQVFHKYQL